MRKRRKRWDISKLSHSCGQQLKISNISSVIWTMLDLESTICVGLHCPLALRYPMPLDLWKTVSPNHETSCPPWISDNNHLSLHRQVDWCNTTTRELVPLLGAILKFLDLLQTGSVSCWACHLFMVQMSSAISLPYSTETFILPLVTTCKNHGENELCNMTPGQPY